MSEFTKGEWNFTETPVSLGKGEERSYWYLVGSPERAVGFIRHKEDARLIALAPEMYEVLKKAYDMGHLSWSLSNNQKAEEIIMKVEGKHERNEEEER